MAKRKNQNFSSQRDILNFRPLIQFVEPDQIQNENIVRIEPQTIDSIKSDTDKLIENYKQIEDLSNQAQAKIDLRAKNLVVKLDPAADGHIIEAIRRHFRDPNKDTITYDDYRECLDHINDQANFSTRDDGVVDDLFRTDFGGSGRPELQPNTQTIEPINLADFKIDMIEKLLDLLGPGITKISIDQIKKAIGV